MPRNLPGWRLVPPHTRKDGKRIHYYYVKGTWHGRYLDDSTGTGVKKEAQEVLKLWREQHLRGELSRGKIVGEAPTARKRPATFVTAAVAYIQATDKNEYIKPLLDRLGETPLANIDQIMIDTVAAELYPTAVAATRNRQVYTPISAIMKRAGFETKIKRPSGWQGKKSTSWLEPDQAFAVFAAADKIDAEFGLLCRFLLYTGMRLNEALSRHVNDLRLDRAFIYLEDSKNDNPRGCHLPPVLVRAFRSQPPRPDIGPQIRDARGLFANGKPVEDAGVPYLDRKPSARLFRFHKGGALYDMLKCVFRELGLSFPRRQGGFHIFCHTYGSWMHRYGKLDTHGLTRTGRWADPDSADRYVHTGASEEAQRSDLMPTPSDGQIVDITPRLAANDEK